MSVDRLRALVPPSRTGARTHRQKRHVCRGGAAPQHVRGPHNSSARPRVELLRSCGCSKYQSVDVQDGFSRSTRDLCRRRSTFFHPYIIVVLRNNILDCNLQCCFTATALVPIFPTIRRLQTNISFYIIRRMLSLSTPSLTITWYFFRTLSFLDDGETVVKRDDDHVLFRGR